MAKGTRTQTTKGKTAKPTKAEPVRRFRRLPRTEGIVVPGKPTPGANSCIPEDRMAADLASHAEYAQLIDAATAFRDVLTAFIARHPASCGCPLCGYFLEMDVRLLTVGPMSVGYRDRIGAAVVATQALCGGILDRCGPHNETTAEALVRMGYEPKQETLDSHFVAYRMAAERAARAATASSAGG